MMEIGWEESVRVLDGLHGLPLEDRVAALEGLLRSESSGVREQALRVGAVVLPDETLVDYLRDDADAVLRNAGLEILKARGKRSFQLAVDVLDDKDPDVALQAVLILNHLRDPRAVEPLRAMLSHEDVNVVQATILALGHLGGPQTVSDLLPFLESDPWLQIASIQALGDLRSEAAIEPLRDRLTDLMIGPLAAEALAHIGGERAFEALVGHWLAYHDDLDPEMMLGLLAHVLSGLLESAPEIPGFRVALSERLRDPYRAIRLCAARCLLALGRGPEDGAALSILADARKGNGVLPGCLAQRRDLALALMQRSGVERSWGFLLAAEDPSAIDAEAIASAMRHDVRAIEIGPVVALLEHRRGPEIASALVELFLELGADERAALRPAFEDHRSEIETEIDRGDWDMSHEDRIVLSAWLGSDPSEVAAQIMDLPFSSRGSAVTQLAATPEVMRRLSWSEWLDQDPESCAPLVGAVASASRLSELLPLLRDQLRRRPVLEVVRALGDLGDRESVPALSFLLTGPASLLQVTAIESLGRIGGPEARDALARLIRGGDEQRQRLAYRALAECANEEDEPLFREGASHPDWCVRLASASVLGRCPRPENREPLARLAADPVSIVSERALSLLQE